MQCEFLAGAGTRVFRQGAPYPHPSQPDWDLQNVKVPLLVMNTRSPFYAPEYESYARSISARTDYRAFDGVGHFMMLEKPAMFNSALADMLHEFNLLAQ